MAGGSSAIATSPLPTGVFVHVAAVMSGSANITLFVNGSPVSATVSGSGMPHSRPLDWLIGVDSTRTNNRFVGVIDELGVFSRALTPSEICSISTRNSLGRCFGPPASTAGLLTRTIMTEWHPDWRKPARVSEPLRRTTYGYDALGNTTSVTIEATGDKTGALGFTAAVEGAGRTWLMTYNTRGQILTVDGPRDDVSDRTTYTYYADAEPPPRRNQLQLVTNALGQTTEYRAYDAHGFPIEVVDSNGATTFFEYDAMRRIVSRRIGSEITTYTYHPTGQIKTLTQNNGAAFTFGYDDAHRLTTMTDSAGNVTSFTPNLANGITSEERISSTGVRQRLRTRQFNALGQLFKEFGGTNAAQQVTEYSYNALGDVVRVLGPSGQVSESTYDALGRLQTVRDADGGVVTHAYDALDQLRAVRDQRFLTTTFVRNGHGDLLSQISPDTGTTTFPLYDAAGQVRRVVDSRGVTRANTYDALGRIRTATWSGAGFAPLTDTYEYDDPTPGRYGIGRLTRVIDSTGTTSFHYDAAGRVRLEERTVGTKRYATSYLYDGSGRLTSITYPSGRVIAYTGFDSLGRATSITSTVGMAQQTIVSNIVYDAAGEPTSYTLGNGQIVTRTFDLDGRVSTFTMGARTMKLEWDDSDRLKEWRDLADPAATLAFQYDALDRLNSMTSLGSPGLNRSWTYDAAGNRRTQTAGGSTSVYLPSKTNNSLSYVIDPAVRSLTYSATGATSFDGVRSFVANAKDRVSTITVGNRSLVYLVNALGQRVMKLPYTGSVAGKGVVFVSDRQGRLLAEADLLGRPLKDYVYLGDSPIVVFNSDVDDNRVPDVGTSTYYVNVDHLGTPRSVLDAAQTEVWHWPLTDAFGNTAPNEDPDANGTRFAFHLRFPGQYFDGETGLFHNGARDYDPRLGRYAQSDPAGLAGGLNTYVYVENDPLGWVDPAGRSKVRPAAPPVAARGGGYNGGVFYPAIGAPRPPPARTEPSQGLQCRATPSPALPGSPYSPEVVQSRVKPEFRPNAAHDQNSSTFNPRKTPEPRDSEPVYRQAQLGEIGTWYGRGEQGWYRYFYDNAGGSHFSGIVPQSSVPAYIVRTK